MAFVAADWSIDRQTKNIRYIGDAHGGASPSYATVLEFHRALQDFADNAVSSGDDELDITDPTPSDRSTDNIVTLLNSYNIDDTAAEHLYDGSIQQAGGDTLYSGLVVVGTVESGTNLQIVQDNGLLTNYWTTGLNTDAANNIIMRLMIKTRDDGVDIDGKRLRVQARELGDTYAEFNVTAGLGNSTAAVFTSSDLNNQTASGTIAGWTITNTEGLNLLDVDGNAVNEEYYSQWDRGSQTINDLYEYTKYIQRRGTAETIHSMNGELFRGITHSFAYDAEAGTGPVTNDIYSWGLQFNYDNEASGPFTVGEALTIGTAKGRLLALDDDGLTGSMVVSIESGTVADNDAISGASSSATADVNGSATGATTGGGTVHKLAVDDDGTTGNLYVQLLTGTAPTDNTILYEQADHANTVTVNGTVTQRTVSPEFIGQSTGSAIIGAYGVGIQPSDLTSSDTLFDLTNTQRVPPNNVTFTVSGLVSGEDYVTVTNNDVSTDIDYNQLSLNTALTADNITSVVVSTTIPSDTPADGHIRVADDNGFFRKLHYSSYSGSTFTVDTTDGQEDFATVNASVSNDVYIAYIDELATGTTASFTSVYNADRTLFIRVRDGGASPIKTFETTGTLGSAGGSSTAIRTSDA